jgi:hypothetical protein
MQMYITRARSLQRSVPSIGPFEMNQMGTRNQMGVEVPILSREWRRGEPDIVDEVHRTRVGPIGQRAWLRVLRLMKLARGLRLGSKRLRIQ